MALEPLVSPITFESEGDRLVGTLFLPAGHRPGQRHPLVIVTGSWLTVKEQMPEQYARRLAAEGLAALTFDFRGFGESGGSPRQYESPARKIRDIRQAAELAATLPVTAPDRIGALAVCASAGYAAHAIAEGAGIRSLVTVAAWLHDAASLGQIYGGDEGVRRREELGRAARERFERTGQVDVVPAYDPQDPDAAMFFPLDYYANRARGAIPRWKNEFAVMSWLDWIRFEALSPAARIAVPTLLVHSDGCVFPENARRFHAALAGPRELYWSQGEQTDFYDREPHVTRSARVAAAHFRATLPSADAG